MVVFFLPASFFSSDLVWAGVGSSTASSETLTPFSLAINLFNSANTDDLALAFKYVAAFSLSPTLEDLKDYQGDVTNITTPLQDKLWDIY
mgnify:CR=1 FL=1